MDLALPQAEAAAGSTSDQWRRLRRR